MSSFPDFRVIALPALFPETTINFATIQHAAPRPGTQWSSPANPAKIFDAEFMIHLRKPHANRGLRGQIWVEPFRPFYVIGGPSTTPREIVAKVWLCRHLAPRERTLAPRPTGPRVDPRSAAPTPGPGSRDLASPPPQGLLPQDAWRGRQQWRCAGGGGCRAAAQPRRAAAGRCP